MKLSERGAIRSAIADGGFHLYPAGRLMDIIKSGLEGDNLTGDFLPNSTLEKLEKVKGPLDTAGAEIFKEDMDLLKSRLKDMDPDYDIESVFARIIQQLPGMAKRYYGIDDFAPVKPQVIEYFFEGYNDLYKTSDWFAFNVSKAESVELSVPVGTYFKRDQVSPGMPEYVTMHEANHALQEKTCAPDGVHHYVPWMDEGFADALGRIMLFRATGDESLIAKIKNFRTEVDVTDFRKVTYHYGEETSLLVLLRGRLAFAKALMRARKRDPMSIDWNNFALLVKAGHDPHVAIAKSCSASVQKRIERDEKEFRSGPDLDQQDLRIIQMFLATTAPATLDAATYKAALWIDREAKQRPSPHYLDPSAVSEGFRGKINNFSHESLIECASLTEEFWKKHPMADIKVVIKEDAVPAELKDALEKLSASYFVIRKKLGESIVYEPYGGGLPYRLATGEIRCTY